MNNYLIFDRIDVLVDDQFAQFMIHIRYRSSNCIQASYNIVRHLLVILVYYRLIMKHRNTYFSMFHNLHTYEGEREEEGREEALITILE